MANKKTVLGLLAMVLLFGMIIFGCENDLTSNNSGYTFEFKLQNVSGSPVTKIEFINGSSLTDSVLTTETIYLGSGEMTNVYRVSGFTKRHESNKNIYCVRLTWDYYGTEVTGFNWYSATDRSKILILTGMPGSFSFTTGGW